MIKLRTKIKKIKNIIEWNKLAKEMNDKTYKETIKEIRNEKLEKELSIMNQLKISKEDLELIRIAIEGQAIAFYDIADTEWKHNHIREAKRLEKYGDEYKELLRKLS